MEASHIYDSDQELKHKRRAEQDTAQANAELFQESAQEMFAPRTNSFDAIRRAESNYRATMLLNLQTTRGNQYVQQLLSQSRQSPTRAMAQHSEPTAEPQHTLDSSATTFSLAVTIPRSPRIQTRDAGPGDEEFAASEMVEEEFLTPLEELIEPQEGETVALPDIVAPETVGLGMTDAVAGTLSYEPTIRQGGITLPATDFGFTGFYRPSVINIAVTRSSSRYEVSATVRNSIRWDVRADTGPQNQVNIESDTSAAITDENYPDIARDLTPNSADLNGRPRRAGFWAKDLSARHEEFHADEYAQHGREGAILARNWLNAQSVSAIGEVWRLLDRVPDRIVTSVAASMAAPANEQRAYGDGTPLYRDRANSIQSKGDNSDYA